MVGYGCYEGRNWKHGGAVNLEEKGKLREWEGGRTNNIKNFLKNHREIFYVYLKILI